MSSALHDRIALVTGANRTRASDAEAVVRDISSSTTQASVSPPRSTRSTRPSSTVR